MENCPTSKAEANIVESLIVVVVKKQVRRQLAKVFRPKEATQEEGQKVQRQWAPLQTGKVLKV